MELPLSRRLIAALALVAVPALSAAAQAQISPNGPPFQVNTYTTGRQRDPDLAVSSDGSLVVEGQGALLNLHPSAASDAAGNSSVSCWSDVPVGDDTSYSSIQARRFDALFSDGFESGGAKRWSSTLP